MNTLKLLKYISESEALDESTVKTIESVVNKYPYFQTARLLLSKNLFATDKNRFEEYLPITSALCADRKKLFYLINNEKYKPFFEQNEINDKAERTDEILSSFLKSTEIEIAPKENIIEAEETIVSIDYLSFIQGSEENYSADNEKEAQNDLKHQDIIDSFLEKAESNEINIQPLAKDTRKATKPDISPNENSILTETLARIYIKQKKYEQALTIIQQLSLNFPKKSAYFADQIRFLELLILNEKNNKD